MLHLQQMLQRTRPLDGAVAGLQSPGCEAVRRTFLAAAPGAAQVFRTQYVRYLGRHQHVRAQPRASVLARALHHAARPRLQRVGSLPEVWTCTAAARKSYAPCSSFLHTEVGHDVGDADAPGKVLLALLLDFDIEQDERVHPKIGVLAHAIVEAVWPPGVGEEDEGDGLAKVVQLQAACSDSVHNGRVVYDARRYAERACAEEDVGVGSCSERITDDEKRYILDVSISQDFVTFCLDHVTVGKNKRFSIELLL